MELSFSRFEILTGTGATFLCLFFVCLFLEVSAIQTGIGTAAAEAVEQEDLFWVSAEARGQHLVLTGAAVDAFAVQRAGDAAAAVPGVSGVDNRIAILGQGGECQRRVDDYLADQSVKFKAGRADLSESSLPVLAAVAGILRDCGAGFEVASHTDAEGDSAMNLTLSQRRAEVAVRYLVHSGASPAGLRAVGYGEAQPVADNATQAGRVANSRLEFRVVADHATFNGDGA